jgi:hypothetical protein
MSRVKKDCLPLSALPLVPKPDEIERARWVKRLLRALTSARAAAFISEFESLLDRYGC